MRFILLGFCVAAIALTDANIGVSSFANAAQPENLQRDETIMPSGFEGIKLGMLQSDVVMQKKNLNPQKDDEGKMPNILIENGLKSPFYDTVIYGFNSSDSRLLSTTFKIEKLSDYIREHVPFLCPE